MQLNLDNEKIMKAMIVLFIVTIVLLWMKTVHAQKVMLDESLKAGPLTVFHGVNNSDVFYHLSDKPGIAMDANFKPQFSSDSLIYVDGIVADAATMNE